MSMRRASRPVALLAAATLTAAALTACGGGDSSPAAQQADPSEPFTPAAAEEEEVTPDTWPLTGLEVAEGGLHRAASREADAQDVRILRREHHLVEQVWIEAALHAHLGRIGSSGEWVLRGAARPGPVAGGNRPRAGDLAVD
jgi:hypothetical protein